MQQPKSLVIDGMKFMWDGIDYANHQEAETARAEYESKSFETRILEEDGKHHVYTRRVVKEVVVEGAPPDGS